MNWSYVTIGLYIILLVLNGYFWFRYNKNTAVEQRKKEGWSNYYKIAGVFVLMLLLKKINL